MWIVAIAWIYVVGLMALTEASVVAGVMTFVGYCVLPLSILFYITGGKRRRQRKLARDAAATASLPPPPLASPAHLPTPPLALPPQPQSLPQPLPHAPADVLHTVHTNKLHDTL
jgi:hypothetical protein